MFSPVFAPCMALLQRLKSLFFEGEELRALICLFSHSVTHSKSVCDVICKLLDGPLQFVFSEDGVFFFDNYNLVFPYKWMNAQQYAFMQEILKTCTGRIGECLSSTPVLDDRITTVVRTQMGGGHVVRIPELCGLQLGPSEVLKALMHAVLGTEHHRVRVDANEHDNHIVRRNTLSILLQRIIEQRRVPRNVVNEIFDEMQKLPRSPDVAVPEHGREVYAKA